MTTRIDSKQFGPWALVTGASSGIGREFARQIAASGINTVLVARRQRLLEEAGREFAKEFGVQYRTVAVDLSEGGFLQTLAQATWDLDIGLVISNAGTGNPGEFLKLDRDEMAGLMRLNAFVHMEIAHHFGRRLADRGRGGIVLGGAMGAAAGIPYMANDSGSKAYVQAFGEALHVELKPLGVNVTVLIVAPTQTAIIDKFGMDPKSMPMKPMTTEQCAREGLQGLVSNRSTILPGRVNRIMDRLVPTSVARVMMGKMMVTTLSERTVKQQAKAVSR
jgi:short-subunit dehydrogenase